MTRYDLGEYRKITWVRALQWFRVGLVAFAGLLIVWIAYGVVQLGGAGELSPVRILGAGLGYVILGGLLLMGLLMRAPARAIVIDENGVLLDYGRGMPDVREWNDSRTSFRGRWTSGVDDAISRGRAFRSVYGRHGAFSESFVPEAAFSELLAASRGRGFEYSETKGRPGWFLYSIRRESFELRAQNELGSANR